MNILSEFKNVKAIVMDVDGVLTNGSLILLDDGQMARTMNIKDGYALQLAIKKGFQLLVISGGSSEGVKQRLEKLGITDVHMGIADKKILLERYMKSYNLKQDEVLYIGDDIPDLEVMMLAGLRCCPADAVPEIISISNYISPSKGGEGCVRDILEKVLKLNNKWDVQTGLSSL